MITTILFINRWWIKYTPYSISLWDTLHVTVLNQMQYLFSLKKITLKSSSLYPVQIYLMSCRVLVITDHIIDGAGLFNNFLYDPVELSLGVIWIIYVIFIMMKSVVQRPPAEHGLMAPINSLSIVVNKINSLGQ